jgi:hypothetical protein
MQGPRGIDGNDFPDAQLAKRLHVGPVINLVRQDVAVRIRSMSRQKNHGI